MNTSEKCGGSFVAGLWPGDSTIQVASHLCFLNIGEKMF